MVKELQKLYDILHFQAIMGSGLYMAYDRNLGFFKTLVNEGQSMREGLLSQ